MRKIIAVYLILVGAIFIFFIPPFQKADETTHFKKALAVTHGVFYCPANNQITVPKQFTILINEEKLQSIIAKENKKMGLLVWINEVFSTKANYQPSVINIASICQLPPISYLPQSVGLLISQFLYFNQFLSFFSGRFFAYIFFLIWFYFLLKHCPKSIKPLILLTFFLPMTLHQLTSYSYDGVQIMLALTIFVSGIKLVESRLKKINWVIVLIIAFVGFLICRAVVKVAYPTTINPADQIILLKTNPFSILEIIIKTTFIKFPFYLQGVIGIFGWLEYGLDYFTYFFYILLILFTIYQTKLEKKLLLLNWQNIILGSIIFIFYLFLLFINYLFWTPYKSKVIEGIQGRYFLLIFPFLLFFLINIRQRYFPKMKIIKLNIPNWLIAAVCIIIITLIFQNIVSRFYF